MLETLKAFFNEEGWEFSQVGDKSVFFLGISGFNGRFQCYADIIDDYKFVFYSICGANSPEEKRIAIAELITRLNFGKFLGNFEMDFEDGEVRFKTSIYYKDIVPTPEMIRFTIINNIYTMDTCLRAFMSVMFGNMSPLEAFTIAEASDESTPEEPVTSE